MYIAKRFQRRFLKVGKLQEGTTARSSRLHSCHLACQRAHIDLQKDCIEGILEVFPPLLLSPYFFEFLLELLFFSF